MAGRGRHHVSIGLQRSPHGEAVERAAPRSGRRDTFPSRAQAGALALVVFVLFVAGDGARVTSYISAGVELTDVATSPLALVASAAATVLWLRVMRLPPGQIRAERPSLRRRIGAMLIDAFLAGNAAGCVTALFPLALESFATGSWAWSFQRPSVTADVVLSLAAVLAVLAGVVLWMAWPAARGRQSVGAYMMGIRLARADDARPSLGWAVRHVLMGLLALCAGPVTLLAGADAEGRYWNDRTARSRVVRVDPGT